MKMDGAFIYITISALSLASTAVDAQALSLESFRNLAQKASITLKPSAGFQK